MMMKYPSGGRITTGQVGKVIEVIKSNVRKL